MKVPSLFPFSDSNEKNPNGLNLQVAETSEGAETHEDPSALTNEPIRKHRA